MRKGHLLIVSACVGIAALMISTTAVPADAAATKGPRLIPVQQPAPAPTPEGQLAPAPEAAHSGCGHCGLCHCDPCAAKTVQVLELTHPYTCCAVQVEICVPACGGCPEVDRDDDEIEYEWDCCDYEVEIKFEKCGTVSVHYDD